MTQKTDDLQSLREEQDRWAKKVGAFESKLSEITSRKARLTSGIDALMTAVASGASDPSSLSKLEMEAEELGKNAGFVVRELATARKVLERATDLLTVTEARVLAAARDELEQEYRNKWLNILTAIIALSPEVDQLNEIGSSLNARYPDHREIFGVRWADFFPGCVHLYGTADYGLYSVCLEIRKRMKGPIPAAIERAISQYEAVIETARRREAQRQQCMNEAHNAITAERERAELIALDKIKYGPKSEAEEQRMAAYSEKIARLRSEAR